MAEASLAIPSPCEPPEASAERPPTMAGSHLAAAGTAVTAAASNPKRKRHMPKVAATHVTTSPLATAHLQKPQGGSRLAMEGGATARQPPTWYGHRKDTCGCVICQQGRGEWTPERAAERRAAARRRREERALAKQQASSAARAGNYMPAAPDEPAAAAEAGSDASPASVTVISDIAPEVAGPAVVLPLALLPPEAVLADGTEFWSDLIAASFAWAYAHLRSSQSPLPLSLPLALPPVSPLLLTDNRNSACSKDDSTVSLALVRMTPLRTSTLLAPRKVAVRILEDVPALLGSVRVGRPIELLPYTDSWVRLDASRSELQAKARRFIACMHTVQGDRSFSPWKGSVVDAVVGAFLTQNVNDTLSRRASTSPAPHCPATRCRSWQKASQITLNGIKHARVTCSSAFMSLAARFPPAGHHSSGRCCSRDGAGGGSEGRSCPDMPSLRCPDFNVACNCWQEEGSGSREVPVAAATVSECHKAFGDAQQSTWPCGPSGDVAGEAAGLPADTLACGPLGMEAPGTAVAGAAKLANVWACPAPQPADATAAHAAEVLGAAESPAALVMPKPLLIGMARARHEFSEGGHRGARRDWEAARRVAAALAASGPPAPPPDDKVDWAAVMAADLADLADAIKERGMQFSLAGRIKALLTRLHAEHGSIDLEWLRLMRPEDAQDFLVGIRGLGLKSTECIRLLTLHHSAFPVSSDATRATRNGQIVDTNVGRICTRLGWVPLEPLPEELQLHLLELYPVQASIQRYLWPRLSTLDQRTLYELHYQMITFGKIFCTKRSPNCRACPLRSECRHYCSAISSARARLPAPPSSENSTLAAMPEETSQGAGQLLANTPSSSEAQSLVQVQPIFEEPVSPRTCSNAGDVADIEDVWQRQEAVDVDNDPPLEVVVEGWSSVTIPAGQAGPPAAETVTVFTANVQSSASDWAGYADRADGELSQADPQFMEHGQSASLAPANVHSLYDELQGGVSYGAQSLALVPLEDLAFPLPKLKDVHRLRSIHHVYELPDDSPVVASMDAREVDDPSPYLLAKARLLQEARPQNKSLFLGPKILQTFHPDECHHRSEVRPCGGYSWRGASLSRACCWPLSERAAFSMESESATVLGTILIPCRTALHGNFPLNGTYFQVNEVFADDLTSNEPLRVPRVLLWRLRRRLVYFGSSATSIFRGLTSVEISAAFTEGYVCSASEVLAAELARPRTRLELKVATSGELAFTV
eukprot:SM000012S25424  [mRNA]  locus=s12:1037722:1044960:+ [translate_table: standard]